jgi:amino acid transporter/nucleotide-binding universal stress UspA family protein
VLQITLRRDLGLFHTTMIGIGTMIGASIFSLAAITTGIAGPNVLFSIMIAGGICFLTASTYAQLGGLLQEAGGGYLWVKMAFSRRAGFTAGWISWFGHSVACAFYIILFAGGIEFLLHAVSPGTVLPIPKNFLAVGVALVFVFINDRGTVLTARTEAIVTMIQLAIFTLFGVAAIYVGTNAPYTPGPGDLFPDVTNWNILVAAGVLAIAFEGYEVVAQSAEETKNPERTIPRATYISIAVVTAFYLLLVGSAFFAEGPAQVASDGDRALIAAGGRFIPVGGALLMIGALLAGALSALNATIFSASRVAFAMGRDGTLPKAFGAIHRRKRTPHVAIRVSGVAIIGTALFVPLNDIAAAAGIMFLLLFILVNASFLRLRQVDAKVRARFPSAKSNIVPIAAISGKVIILTALAAYSPLAMTIAIVWSALGIIVYWLAHRSGEAPAPPPTASGYAAEGPTIPAERFHILVPAASPREKRLVEMASLVTRASNGHLSIMRVIPVPRATPIWAASEIDTSFDLKMVEGLLGFAGPDVDASAVLMVSHEIEGAIAEKAREDNVNLIFVGWRGSTKTRKAIFGGTVDDLLLRAPCDVAVVRTRIAWEPSQFKRIALLSGPHRHVRPAADLVAALSRDHPVQVTVLRVVKSHRERALPDDDVEEIVEHLHKLGLDTTVRTIVSLTTTSAVIKESERFDLLIIGSPPGLLRKIIVRRAEEEIAKASKCPIILYRHRGTTATDFLQPLARSLTRDEAEPSSLPVGTVKTGAPKSKGDARKEGEKPSTEIHKSGEPGASQPRFTAP